MPFTLAFFKSAIKEVVFNTPLLSVLVLDKLAISVSLCLFAKVSASLPVMVNSAFRCKEVNDAVGSKDTSQHRVGCAADLRVPGMTPDQVVQAIMAAGLAYDQLIREFDRWTHISVSNVESAKPRGQVLIIDKEGTRLYA